MKMKLNYSEFSCLLVLLQRCTSVRPVGIEATAIHGVLKGLYKKFYVRAFTKRKQYTITCEDQEACSFFMFFSRYPMNDETQFTVNVVIRIINFIHQKFTTV